MSGDRRPAAAVILLGFVASLIANHPGHFTPDSIWQLAQGREGLFNDWHPPIMAWLLGLADRVTPGAWSFIVGDTSLFHGALFALVALEPRPRPICLPILVVWMISPIILIYQGVALKDVLFADAALAAFAALAWAARTWERRTLRYGLLVLALLLFVLAALTRQNGFVAPILGAVALGAIVVTRLSSWRRTRRAATAAGVAIIALALVAVLDGAATVALRAHSDRAREDAHHAKILQVFDLAGAVHQDPTLALPILKDHEPTLERFLRQSAAPHYRAAGADNLSDLPGGSALMASDGRAAAAQWVRLIVGRPWLYLAVRTRVWLDTLLTPTAAACPMIFTGIDNAGPMLADAGLKARENDKDDWDSDYATAFLRTSLFSHAFYGVLTFAGLALGVWRWVRGDRRADRIVTIALGLAGLAFAASFFVLSIDCDYRFLYFLDVAAMALAAREAAARTPHDSIARR